MSKDGYSALTYMKQIFKKKEVLGGSGFVSVDALSWSDHGSRGMWGSVVFAEWKDACSMQASSGQDVGKSPPPHPTPATSCQGWCCHPDFKLEAANAVTALL